MNYINKLKLNIPQKAILLAKSGYPDKRYRDIIVNYLNKSDLTNDQVKQIWNSLGYK